MTNEDLCCHEKRRKTMLTSKIIAVDFDGTLCENKWPEIGAPNLELINRLKHEKAQGVKLILWTCRTGDKLTDAVDWCFGKGLLFDAVNRNVNEAIGYFGEDTRKVFADEYIDDKSSHQFDLPFTKREMGITDEVIRKLELVFGFSLYDWQKRYLKGADTAMANGGRQNGKTFAYCVRLLLEDPWTRPSFDLSKWSEIEELVDEKHGPHYRHFFQGYLRNLNNHLIANGFRTNAKNEENPNCWIKIVPGCQTPDEGEEVLVTIEEGDREKIRNVDFGTYFNDSGYLSSANGFFDTINDWDEGQPIYVVAWMKKPIAFCN